MFWGLSDAPRILAPPLNDQLLARLYVLRAFSLIAAGPRRVHAWYTTGCPALARRLSFAAALPCARARSTAARPVPLTGLLCQGKRGVLSGNMETSDLADVLLEIPLW